jgi:hypothetical protein
VAWRYEADPGILLTHVRRHCFDTPYVGWEHSDRERQMLREVEAWGSVQDVYALSERVSFIHDRFKQGAIALEANATLSLARNTIWPTPPPRPEWNTRASSSAS